MVGDLLQDQKRQFFTLYAIEFFFYDWIVLDFFYIVYKKQPFSVLSRILQIFLVTASYVPIIEESSIRRCVFDQK